ncbi:Bug family tripartite tricarboxylate transporter substrate binding protein [Pseudorhodoferax sp.]|uniref:Bug family tripartite tricarboxylate transporter substrate binding protein n=1 Tax=Pseudorhodoferax sp. TaxID=1993553 RepID=UPI002DD62F53|nr:tripartite tricarboxylate transporter substrate binding protein [Pseudorhodoferax sp.]
MPSIHRRGFLQLAGGTAGLCLAWPHTAVAQDSFPTKPLTLIVPYPAGGASDVSARIFAASITQSLNQQVVVENLGGGTGLIGANKLLSSPADGYTFFHGSANEVFLAPLLNPAARYKPQDFMLAAPTGEATLVLLVKHDLPARSIDELLQVAKSRKDKPLTYASVGIDSLYHLMGDALALQTGTQLLHVPYKGGAPALQDVAGGQVDFAILPYQASFEGMQEQGRLRILTSFSKTLPKTLAHIPLISSSKLVPDFEYTIGGGYFVRRGTPAARVQALRKAVGEALAKPEIRGKLEQEGRNVAQPIADQAQADRVFDQQLDRVARLVKTVGRPVNG